MHSRRPIPLFPHPLPSPNQPHDNALLSDDFPPCRIHETPESSPNPPIQSGTSRSRLRSSAVRKAATKRGSPSQSEASSAQLLSQDSESHHSQLKNKGLGQTNILNTVEVKIQNHIPKSSSKRGLDAAHDHPSKRQCRTSVRKDDMDLIKDELDDIKTCLKEIADHLRGDVDIKIEEVIHRLKQMRDMELGY